MAADCRLAIHQLEHTPLLALSHPQLKGVAALETIKVINNVWNMSPESAAPATRLPTFYVSVCLLTSGDSQSDKFIFSK